MIDGYFDPAGRPYVRAYVVVPGLQSAPEVIALLLDTGADNTFIRVDSGKGQNRTLSALWPPVFAGEQDVGPPKG